MSSYQTSVEIEAAAGDVFELLHDYQRRLEWDPFLKEARLLDGAPAAGPGVAARCVAKNRLGGWGMDTIYVSFTPPRVAAVRMVRGPWFFQSFAASLRHEALGPRRSRVCYRFRLTTRPAWLRPLIEPILLAILAHETRRRLRALAARFRRNDGSSPTT